MALLQGGIIALDCPHHGGACKTHYRVSVRDGSIFSNYSERGGRVGCSVVRHPEWIMNALYRCSKNMQHLAEKFASDMKPILARIGTVFTTADRIMEDARPQLKGITRDA